MAIKKINILNKGFIEYVDHMGSDLNVVNAARVSMGKRKEVFDENDAKLIKYLVNHEHTAPLRHVYISLHIKAPIFVFRQLQKHQIGITFSEISGRYIEFDPEDYYYPAIYREQAPSIKQGSGPDITDPDLWGKCSESFGRAVKTSFAEYKNLLSLGVCKEQARTVLPLALYSETITTGSLQAWAHLINLRSEEHAQKEIQLYAAAIRAIIEPLYPVSLSNMLEQP